MSVNNDIRCNPWLQLNESYLPSTPTFQLYANLFVLVIKKTLKICVLVTFVCRYLVMVGREQEALTILHRINRSSGDEGFVNTCFELEELKASCVATKMCFKLHDLCQFKYLTRSVCLSKYSSNGIWLYINYTLSTHVEILFFLP